MPCQSDYLEANSREIELQRAARLLVYVFTELGKPVPNAIQKTANDCYGRGVDCVPLLCEAVRKLKPKDRERIVYNARNAQSRDLAGWWESHEKADRERKAAEQQEAEDASLIQSALTKITSEELRAIRRSDGW